MYLLLFLVNMKFPFDNQETRKWGCMYASLLRHQDYKCSLLFTSPNSYHVLSSRYFRQFLTQDFSSWICQTKYFARGLRTQALLWWRVASVFEPSHPPYSIYFCRAGSIFGRVGPRFELITYLIMSKFAATIMVQFFLNLFIGFATDRVQIIINAIVLCLPGIIRYS